MWVRTCSTGAASVMKAMMRISAPQLGQTRGSDPDSRASSMAQRSRAGERAFGTEALACVAISSRALGSSPASRPYAAAAATNNGTRRLTVEVNPTTQQLVQARGWKNRAPDAEEQQVLTHRSRHHASRRRVTRGRSGSGHSNLYSPSHAGFRRSVPGLPSPAT